MESVSVEDVQVWRMGECECGGCVSGGWESVSVEDV